jgi:hypothetical protein
MKLARAGKTFLIWLTIGIVMMIIGFPIAAYFAGNITEIAQTYSDVIRRQSSNWLVFRLVIILIFIHIIMPMKMKAAITDCDNEERIKSLVESNQVRAWFTYLIVEMLLIQNIISKILRALS